MTTKKKRTAAAITDIAIVNDRLQVSISMLMMAPDCRTRLLLRLAGLDDAGEPPAGSSVSMLGGTWGHKAMAAWLSEADWKEAMAPYETISDELGIPFDRRGYKNLSKVVEEVIRRYPYSQLPFELLSPQTTEVSFVCPLGTVRDGKNGSNVHVDLIGYIDKLVADKRTGIKMPLEHKFTGKLDDAFIGRFAEYDPQTTAYMLAAETILGEKIGDAWVNAIEMSLVPSSDRKCKKHGVDYAECGPQHVKQTFIPARRRPEQLEEFRSLALGICEKSILPVARALQLKGSSIATVTPRDGIFTGACDYCEYRRWCLTSNRAPNLMATMLKERKSDDDRLRSGLIVGEKNAAN